MYEKLYSILGEWYGVVKFNYEMAEKMFRKGYEHEDTMAIQNLIQMEVEDKIELNTIYYVNYVQLGLYLMKFGGSKCTEGLRLLTIAYEHNEPTSIIALACFYFDSGNFVIAREMITKGIEIFRCSRSFDIADAKK